MFCFKLSLYRKRSALYNSALNWNGKNAKKRESELPYFFSNSFSWLNALYITYWMELTVRQSPHGLHDHRSQNGKRVKKESKCDAVVGARLLNDNWKINKRVFFDNIRCSDCKSTRGNGVSSVANILLSSS